MGGGGGGWGSGVHEVEAARGHPGRPLRGGRTAWGAGRPPSEPPGGASGVLYCSRRPTKEPRQTLWFAPTSQIEPPGEGADCTPDGFDLCFPAKFSWLSRLEDLFPPNIINMETRNKK